MFSYPESQSNRPAINDVSLSIKPGQLVVIVGANGSGKTSLTKLLTRLYNPTTGDVVIDGQPASSYKLRDLRNMTALLSQDHTLFPVSIAENIGVGWSENVDSEVQVRAAAEKGGASGVVRKLKRGLSTVLHPMQTKNSYGLANNHPLHTVLTAWEKATDVSGGERQRLVA
jgi:ABC-type multidrug transport system fused ATPase/permease subunit